MTKYESSVKTIYAPVGQVFAKLSDLTNLEVLRQNAANPDFLERIRQQAGDKVKPEQVEQVAQRLQSMQCTPDTVSVDAAPLGNIILRIIEREEPKLVKFAVEGAPMGANLWVQLLPASDTQCALKLTLGADLNFFMKQIVGGKLKDGVDKMADMLAMLPY